MKFTYQELKALSSNDAGNFSTDSPEKSYEFSRKLATSHYENFPVGSFIVPKSKSKYFYSIYAFARLCDDIADELIDISKTERVSMLENIESLLNLETSEINSPIIKAARDTINNTQIEAEDLTKLIKAFKMDINFTQAVTYNDLICYCIYSANPIGEMLLKLFDEASEENVKYSDDVCTALQLVNFWQDISVDIEKDRMYIPIEILDKYDLDNNSFFEEKNRISALKCLNEVFEFTENLFKSGKNLVHLVNNRRLKWELRFIIASGLTIFDKVKNSGIQLRYKRPKLKLSDKLTILIKTIYFK